MEQIRKGPADRQAGLRATVEKMGTRDRGEATVARWRGEVPRFGADGRG